MKNTVETISIINLISLDKSKQYINESMLLMFARGKLSSINFHKKKLGKQKYCWATSVRYWIWTSDTWRVYVSKRGAAFEVLDTLTPDEAWIAWQDYYNKMI